MLCCVLVNGGWLFLKRRNKQNSCKIFCQMIACQRAMVAQYQKKIKFIGNGTLTGKLKRFFWKTIFDWTAVIFCSVTSAILISEFLPFIRQGRNGRGCILKTHHLWKQRSSCNYSYRYHWRPVRWARVLPGGWKNYWETNYGKYLDRFIEIIYVLNNNFLIMFILLFINNL